MFAGIIMRGKKEMYCEIDCDKLRNLYHAHSSSSTYIVLLTVLINCLTNLFFLRPQHLSGLQLLSDLSGGRLQGGTVGSTEITLTPERIRAGNYVADTKTAGYEGVVFIFIYIYIYRRLCVKTM